MKLHVVALVIAVAMSRAEALVYPVGTSQIIPQFPEGVWDGNDCSNDTVDDIQFKCIVKLNQLGDDATLEEKLACALMTVPGQHGMIPLGIYPSSLKLDTELLSLDSRELTQAFDRCALAKMIHSACFSYLPNTWAASNSFSKYTTIEEYADTTSETYGISVDSGVGIGPIAVRAGVSNENAEESETSSNRKTAGLTRSWKNSYATLTMNACMRTNAVKVENLLNRDYVKLWNDFAEISDPVELSKNPSFQQVMEKGFYVPTSFGFAVQYNSQVSSSYEEKSSSSSTSMDQALNGGIDVSAFGGSLGISGGMVEAIANTQAARDVNARVQGEDFKYGACDFDALMQNPENWANILEECSTNAAFQVDGIVSPSFIPKGGFTPITTILENGGVKVNEHYIEAANMYFAYCACDDPTTTTNNKFTCFKGDGTFDSRGIGKQGCIHTFWWLRNGAPHL